MVRYTSIIIVGFLFSWMPAPAGLAAEKLSVFVSIAPQKYFVQQISKDLVDVHIMVPPGADPHTYEPRPQQMVAISKAKLYFAIGSEFEAANLANIVSTNPKITVVHTDRGIQKIPMAGWRRSGEDEHHIHRLHASEDGRDKDNGLDPHIWLSPQLVKIQADNILHALEAADMANRSFYEENHKSFVAEIAELDRDLRTVFKGSSGLRFMVFHPSWGYFAQNYGLTQVPIEIEGKSPKPAQLEKLIRTAREGNIRVVFVQPQFSPKSAELLAGEIGGEVVWVDPLAENWLVNLREMADKFKAALQ